MPQKPKRKLPLYTPRIMTDLMLATTKDSTCIHFGFGRKCHKHGRLFDLEHVRTCSELTGCPDIAQYAQMLKGILISASGSRRSSQMPYSNTLS